MSSFIHLVKKYEEKYGQTEKGKEKKTENINHQRLKKEKDAQFLCCNFLK